MAQTLLNLQKPLEEDVDVAEQEHDNQKELERLRTAGAGVKKAVTWKREDFWHPGDSTNFDRDWRQELEPNNSNSWIEYKWRSFDPELGLNSEEGWIEFANRYKLLVDEFGNSYHVSWNLGMRDIAKPLGV